MRPLRLLYRLARQELLHYWLDIKYRSSINGIQFGYDEFCTFAPENAANGAADTVWPIFSALRKNANSRPSFIVSWMTGAKDHF